MANEGENVNSVAEAQEQGLFKSGHFEAGNAVITEPGVTFSIAALHASPHSFRKFSTDFMGKGEGAQAYGWGLYFAQNPEVNRSYMNQFAQDKTTWKFREVETGVIEVMQRSLVNSFCRRMPCRRRRRTRQISPGLFLAIWLMPPKEA